MLLAAGVAVAGAVGLIVATRSSSDSSAAVPLPSAVSEAPHRVVVPGRPGESAEVTLSDRVKAPDGVTYNGIDTTFVQMMIVHHGQAIEMAGLAGRRASNVELRALADRIGAAQAPEVTYLRTWLRARKLPETDPSHDHSTMPGMQTPADMAALRAATGAEFDRKFVAMMTDHHRGAQQMAGDVITGGQDELLREMANEMAVEQGSEVRRMAQLGI
ncbi:DUF305 domain-containing protein [Actinoplanes sp. TBRC 11911]|nr:DUF305 domain-containing protein [Actinoplanes sp. TBRC 11911]